MDKKEYIEFLKEIKSEYENEKDEIGLKIKQNSKESSKYTKCNIVLLTLMLFENFISSIEQENISIKYLWDIIILQELIFVIINISKHEKLFSNTDILEEKLVNYEKQINTMENVLEFFYTTDDNEIKKFLKYKIN